jgi:hypothetical protein
MNNGRQAPYSDGQWTLEKESSETWRDAKVIGGKAGGEHAQLRRTLSSQHGFQPANVQALHPRVWQPKDVSAGRSHDVMSVGD